MSALFTAVSLGFDTFNIAPKAPLSLIALISFIIFVSFVGWGWYSAEKRIKELEGKSTNTALRKAQDKHLNGIRVLITKWENTLMTPGLDVIFFGMPSIPTQDIEAQPLFCSLREHLPFSIFWGDYSIWRDKVRAYIEGCQKVMKTIGEVEHDSISEDMKMWGTKAVAEAMSLSPPLSEMMKKYQETATSDLELQSLLAQLKVVENRLHKCLQEGLEGGDHIKHTCRLCPMK